MIKQGNGGITVIDLFNDPSKPPVISALNITTQRLVLLKKADFTKRPKS